MAARPPGRCIFCRSGGLTKEDVLPLWLSQLFPEQNLRHVMESKDFGVLKVRASAPLRLTARVVCARCNNEWMSALEERVRPILSRLILGRRSTLDAAAQTELATWAVKTAYLFRYAARPVRPVPQSWLQSFYSDRSFPPSTVVWLARYEGEAVCRAWATPLILRRPSVPNETREGELFTLALGQAVIQVAFVDYDGLTMHIQTPKDADRYLEQVWPCGDDRSWPPAEGLTDGALENLSLSLVTSGGG